MKTATSTYHPAIHMVKYVTFLIFVLARQIQA